MPHRRRFVPAALFAPLVVASIAHVALAQCPAPAQLTASDDQCGAITLTWSPVANATGYVIWRNDEPNPVTASLLTIVPATTTHSDFSPTPGQLTHYWIQAQCGAQGTSPFSAIASGSSVPTPTPPQGIAATQGTRCDGVLLSWSTPPAGTEYRIHRATNEIFANAEIVGVAVDADSFLDESAPASTSTNSLWYFVVPVTPCGEGAPVPVEGWRCVPTPRGSGVPDLAVSNWRARAAATLLNACRVGPQQFRDFFFVGVSGIEQVLQPQNYAAQPPLQWNTALAAAANYHAIDVSTTPGCDPFVDFTSCNGVPWFTRLAGFLGEPVGASGHLPFGAQAGPNPPAALVEAMENPAFNFGFQLLGGTVALPDSQDVAMRNFVFDLVGTQRQFGVGFSLERAYNGFAFGSMEKIGAVPSAPTAIVIASHTPDRLAENILYIAIFDDPSGLAPRSAQVEIDGVLHAMDVLSGSAARGAHLFTQPMCDDGEPCRRYRFRFVTAAGAELWYPEFGRLGTAGLPCDCDTEFDDGTASTCVGDLNADGAVDGADLGILLEAWGSADASADLNGDGVVDGADLGVLLEAWGACPR